MQESVKLVPVLVLLTANASLLAQERTGETEPKASSQKMTVIDSRMRDEILATTKDMDRQLEELKTGIERERAAAADPRRLVSPAEREALDAQILALQRSIQQLQQATENGPRYLDQKNLNRP